MAYILAFLAKECGWTLEYILNSMTIQQVQLYFEQIQYAKIDDLKAFANVNGTSVAYGHGNLKSEQFIKYVKDLDPRNRTIKDQIAEMKEKGLPIEEI